MTARYYFTDEDWMLEDKWVPTLVSNAFKTGKSLPSGLLNSLVRKGKSLIMPDDQFLVIVGMTEEISAFRDGITSTGVDSITCTSHRSSDLDQLITWVARVDLKHPDRSVPGKTTVTAIVIGRECLFEKNWNRLPHDPWDSFAATLRDTTMRIGAAFDNALAAARKVRKAN